MVCTTFMVRQTLTEEILLDQSCQSISFYTYLPLLNGLFYYLGLLLNLFKERFHLLLFSIKDSIFPIHTIGKFCNKQEKDFVFLTENFRLLIENFVFLKENFNFF